MATLDQIKRMIKENTTLEIAKENEKLYKEEERQRREVRKTMYDMGIGAY